MRSIIILTLGLIFSVNILAQTNDTVELKTATNEYKMVPRQNNEIESSSNPTIKELKPFSSWEFSLSLSVLAFGIIVLGLEVFLVWKHMVSQDAIVKFIIVTLIITSTLFLITAGYDNNQIAPAMGLLGTIAGYLLGKHDKDENK
jgi:hypothetical protein